MNLKQKISEVTKVFSTNVSVNCTQKAVKQDENL